ncbi:MAG: type II toxin-antitoxin system Phd/YefM family antitoxin [Proteobacteria bacterium]|nr:type II toxin-antitoxin system Phd/YefM family antitoxin [Pseudomonadota bacterium]
MKASIVDLRYKTNDILKALDRNESVTVFYHGKIKAIIKPIRKKSKLKVKDHPFFGMCGEHEKTVLDELENMRKPRYDL